MTTSAQYRHYAEECMQSAREAVSETLRRQYLELAELWIKSSLILEAREARFGTTQQSAASKTDGAAPPEEDPTDLSE